MIKAESIGKKYSIGGKIEFDLRSSLRRGISSTFSSNKKEEFWAVKDVSFELEHGDALGIIGRNGSGKSTLLKILSRITEPSKGRFEITGRVSSLLEVGTGFHPELTGRENIYLNGTILGMVRSEIRSKFDQIVDFSGIEDFIETPIKYYSSGMKVRLAFAVAAHLEPEILIIDEVLAVGDSEFQQKCLGKMNEVTQQGRTVLFVSHNIEAINNLCNKGLVLNNGQMRYLGSSEGAVNDYIGMLRSTSEVLVRNFPDIPKLVLGQVRRAGFRTDNPEPNFKFDEKISCWFEFYLKQPMTDPELVISLYKGDAKLAVFCGQDLRSAPTSDPDTFIVDLELPIGILNNGHHHFSLVLQDKHRRPMDRLTEALSFNILNKDSKYGPYDLKNPGLFNLSQNDLSNGTNSRPSVSEMDL